MPVKQAGDVADITIHLNRTKAIEELIETQGEAAGTLPPLTAVEQRVVDLQEMEVNGGPGSPKRFWHGEELVCALVNLHDMPFHIPDESLPEEWKHTQAHQIALAREGRERQVVTNLVAIAHKAYSEMFGEEVPPPHHPTRFCASVNRVADLHCDADKEQIAWLFSLQENSPGYIVFPGYGLKLNLEHWDILIFDPRIHHASWTYASQKGVANEKCWRTNVTLFRDTARD